MDFSSLFQQDPDTDFAKKAKLAYNLIKKLQDDLTAIEKVSED